MQTLFSALVLISSIAIIVSVVLQESDEGGLAALGGSAPKPLFGSNREMSKSATLQRITVVAGVVFMVSTLVLAAK